MDIFDVIDPNNLQNYSNIDFSTVIIRCESCERIAAFDYTQFSMLIDVFDDVNKLEFDDDTRVIFTLSENILYIMYCFSAESILNDKQKLRILFKLFHRGFSKSRFDKCDGKGNGFAKNDYDAYTVNRLYIIKYYNTIINLFRLTNSETIDICRLDDCVIDTIMMLLLIVKTKVVPKYVMLHKILFYYLC